MFEYSDEDIDTGVAAVDAIEANFANAIAVNLVAGGTGTYSVGEIITGGTSNVSAEVKSFDAATNQIQVYNRTGIFTVPETLTGQTSGAAWTTATYNTLNNTNSEFDINASIETSADGILDFTQGNPFGEFGNSGGSI